MFRTHTCGALTTTHLHHTVTLCGWVHRLRDKKSLLWVDLRDAYGITQVVLQEGHTPPALFEAVRALRREYVVRITGTVAQRMTPNPTLPTGAIEVLPTACQLLNTATLPPFLLDEATDGSQTLRMQYRYLDLRRAPLQRNLRLRHQVAKTIRGYLDHHAFVEVETPILMKATPEGARDFIVPARLQPGHAYALPQSPQTFKQLLMVGGIDRYYQLARCFRDEDLRADRQPEFTQVDCELSFVTQEEILHTFEGMVRHLFGHVKGITLAPLPRLTYQEAMARYGTDKPDLRWAMPLHTLTPLAQRCGFPPLAAAPLVAGITLQGGSSYSRKQLDALTHHVRQHLPTAQLTHVKHLADGTLKSNVAKHVEADTLRAWCTHAATHPGDLLLLLAGEERPTQQALGALRLHCAQQTPPQHPYAPLWVTDFPLLEWDEEAQRYHAMHHPFTAPHPDDLAHFEEAPHKTRSQAYDLVINGSEVGGGSIRIHQPAQQATMFQHLGLTPEQVEEQFGFLMQALAAGAPPHGGIALGLGRLCMILGGDPSLRSYIAFPKNNAGRDTMLHAPALLTPEQQHALTLHHQP